MTRLRSRLADEGGFTLAELVVVLVILGVVLGALTQFLVSGNNAAADLTARFQAQQQGRLALDALRRELHCASSLTLSSSSSITVALGSYCSSAPTGGGTAIWCTVAIPPTSTRYALLRWGFSGTPPAGSSCTSNGVKKADYLTTGAIFGPYTPPGAGLRGKLAIDLPVDAKSTVTSGRYELKDDIVLRNTLRG
jgi:prepilin-type N-terminal cleavage/methylation domain-containing protein